MKLRTTEMQHEFNYPYQLGSYSPWRARDADLYDLKMMPGDVIVMGSDGLFDNVFDEEIVAVVNESMAGCRTDLRGVPRRVMEALLMRASTAASDEHGQTPFSERAVEHGYFSCGGKPDDISVVVAVVSEDEDSPDRR
jgi:serine/threonine protein phosphatase PrpC